MTITSYSGEQEYKFIHDIVYPGFAALKRCGEFLPLNPAVISTIVTKHIAGVGTYDEPVNGIHWEGGWWGELPWTLVEPPPDESAIESVVLTSAANAVAGEFDYLTFMAEFTKNVEYMRQVGSRFNGFTSNLAKAARRFKRNPWKAFTELWLEARYSVRPMIYDYRNAARAISSLGEDLKLSKGMGFEGENLSDSYDGGLVNQSIYSAYRITETLSGSRNYRGASWTSFDSRLARAFQADPLVTAWELVPYSFVVDWFVDIGGWVATIKPRLAGTYRGHQFSVKTVSSLTQAISRQGFNGATWAFSDTQTIIERREYTREPTGIPFPPLLPELTLPRVVDLAALFISGRDATRKILSRR